MKRKLAKLLVGLAALSILAVVGLTGCGGKVVATVDGQVITQEDLDSAMQPYLIYLTGMDGSLEESVDAIDQLFTEHPETIINLFNQNYEIQVTEADLPSIKQNMIDSLHEQYSLGETQCLNELIERKLLLQEAKKQGIKLDLPELQEQWTNIQEDMDNPEELVQWMVSNNCYNQIMFEQIQQEEYQFSKMYNLHKDDYEKYINKLYAQAEIFIAAPYEKAVAEIHARHKTTESKSGENVKPDSSGSLVTPDSAGSVAD